jgi:hypothetical protein
MIKIRHSTLSRPILIQLTSSQFTYLNQLLENLLPISRSFELFLFRVFKQNFMSISLIPMSRASRQQNNVRYAAVSAFLVFPFQYKYFTSYSRLQRKGFFIIRTESTESLHNKSTDIRRWILAVLYATIWVNVLQLFCTRSIL